MALIRNESVTYTPRRILRRKPIQKRFDGTGVTTIQASSPNWEYLKIDEMPYAPERLHYAAGGEALAYVSSQRPGVNGTAYRVALERPEGWTGRKYPTMGFSLSAGHTNETLYMLADFWRESEVPFVGIANKHGNIFSAFGLQSWAHYTRT